MVMQNAIRRDGVNFDNLFAPRKPIAFIAYGLEFTQVGFLEFHSTSSNLGLLFAGHDT